MASIAERLNALFRGLDRAHGRYTPAGGRPGEKIEGSATTIRAPATSDLWNRHLAGDYGLGIVPICEDSTAVWGAIDVDVYVGLDHGKMATDIERLNLPLIVARTKSGGAHLFLFMNEPTPAELVRDRLSEWSILLGYAGVEVFPKQIQLTSNPNDLGNWLNMPYYAGTRSTRYAIDTDGEAIDVKSFVSMAVQKQLSIVQLENWKAKEDEVVDELLLDGPPCLQSLAIHGFPKGTRNNAMFNMGVYLRKRYEDNWSEHLDNYNERFMQPELTHREIVAVRRSIEKKKYNFKCNDQPINQACSKQICLTRKHGIGGESNDPGVVFGDLIQIKTEPEVSYIWDVDGIRLEFNSSKQILDQRIFHQVVMDQIKKLPNFVNEKVWRGIIREKLANAEIVVPPEDLTPTGQLIEQLYAYMYQQAQAKELDEILLGRPYVNENYGYFRLRGFLEHLKRYRWAAITEKQMFAWLRRIGAKPKKRRMKGMDIRYWAVELPEKQTEEFATPELELKEIDG